MYAPWKLQLTWRELIIIVMVIHTDPQGYIKRGFTQRKLMKPKTWPHMRELDGNIHILAIFKKWYCHTIIKHSTVFTYNNGLQHVDEIHGILVSTSDFWPNKELVQFDLWLIIISPLSYTMHQGHGIWISRPHHTKGSYLKVQSIHDSFINYKYLSDKFEKFASWQVPKSIIKAYPTLYRYL